jgi:hypothetical protein
MSLSFDSNNLKIESENYFPSMEVGKYDINNAHRSARKCENMCFLLKSSAHTNSCNSE